MSATSTELYSGIGDKPSSKVLAPPGGKSSIGFGGETAPQPVVPKNSASAAKARDLSTNPLGPAPPPQVQTPAAEKEAAQEVGGPEAPRPRGAPNRAKAPPGGHSQGSFW